MNVGAQVAPARKFEIWRADGAGKLFVFPLGKLFLAAIFVKFEEKNRSLFANYPPSRKKLGRARHGQVLGPSQDDCFSFVVVAAAAANAAIKLARVFFSQLIKKPISNLISDLITFIQQLTLFLYKCGR